MGRAVRADKQARAALDHFMRWYVFGVTYMHGGLYHCTLQDSPLSEARKRTPHSLLYFLMLLLQRLVDQYWKTTASGDEYVQHCVTTMHKCPPAVIGLLVYLHAPRLSPSIALSFPATKSNGLLTARLVVPHPTQQHQHQQQHQHPQVHQTTMQSVMPFGLSSVRM